MSSVGVLSGKVALVTGASRGIGRAIARLFAEAGAQVYGSATSSAGAAAIDAECAAAGLAGMHGVELNVVSAAQCEQVVDGLLKRAGRLDILVNNAGITRDNLAMRMKDDDWQAVIETNLTAVFRLARLAIRPMIKARDGRIINITSVVGSIGNAGQANYAAAKAGVEGMTRALARELGARNVTVNCVAPGFIDTDMTRALAAEQIAQLTQNIPLGRLGSVSDVAHAALYLASPAAAYVTGATLHVNGGMYMA